MQYYKKLKKENRRNTYSGFPLNQNNSTMKKKDDNKFNSNFMP